MNENELKTYKTKLEGERLRLMDEIKKEEVPPQFGTDIDHFEEATDATEEFSNNLAVAGDLRGRLAEIDVALSKVRSGGYGICEKCGKNIEKEVLDVEPESSFCKEDKIVMADAE